MYAEVVAANGEFPGAYMTTSDGRLGVSSFAIWKCGALATECSR